MDRSIDRSRMDAILTSVMSSASSRTVTSLLGLPTLKICPFALAGFSCIHSHSCHLRFKQAGVSLMNFAKTVNKANFSEELFQDTREFQRTVRFGCGSRSQEVELRGRSTCMALTIILSTASIASLMKMNVRCECPPSTSFNGSPRIRFCNWISH